MNANLVKCPCNNCNGHIEFERAHAGEVVLCPHCNLETTLFVPALVPVLTPPRKGLLRSIRDSWPAKPMRLEPAPDLGVIYARPKRGIKTSLGGLVAELLGVILLFAFPIGTIFGILFIVAGAGASRFWRCSNCGNPIVDKQVRICPSCQARFR